MADLDVIANDVAALQRQLLQRERQLQAVLSVTHSLQSQLELGELVRHAVLTAMATVDADAGSLLLHDPERHKLVFRYAEGPSKAKVTGLEIDDRQGIAGEVFHSGEARISLDVFSDRAHILDIDHQTEYTTRTMITVPLRIRSGATVGVLQVLNKHEGQFDHDDLEVLRALATQVAAAIVNAQLYERAQAAIIVDLMGQISHDIKNLLTPVIMAGHTLRLMLDDFHSHVTTELSKPAQDPATLARSVTGMVQQVTDDINGIFDILDESTQIAQQRSKEIADTVKGLTAPAVFELADINEVVSGVCRVLRIVAEQNGVTLLMQPGEVPQAMLDARRMYNALYNLCNNAIAATPAGGRVTLCTSGDSTGTFPDGCYVQVSVADSGHGMPPEVAAMLFTGHVRSTKPGGTGLGTRVVKNVIDAHDGLVTVESTPDAGTTITVRLPIRGVA